MFLCKAPWSWKPYTQFMAQVAAGSEHTLVVTATGAVYAWGRAAWGQTGLGHFDNVCSPQRVHALADQQIFQVWHSILNANLSIEKQKLGENRLAQGLRPI